MAVEPDDADNTEQASDPTEVTEATSEVTVADGDDVDGVGEVDGEQGEVTDRPGRRWQRLARLRLSCVGGALVASAVVVATLTGLAGWLGYRAYDKHEAQVHRDLFVQTAREGAVNLTTISYTEIDADVQRILDSATGAFRDDFEKRSKPFIEVVKAAQSQSEGTISEAGLESVRRDSAQVLVAVAVKSRTAAGEQSPREWRMRINVQAVGDGAKVSNVVFVP
jgi:Mce-associated membrane protein